MLVVLVIVLVVLHAADCTGCAPHCWSCTTHWCGPPVTQVPPNTMVREQAHMLLHEVDTLGDSPSIPPKGKVEPSLAEPELKKAIADTMQIAKLKLDPRLHHVVADNAKQTRYPSNHNTLHLRLVEDGVL